MELIVKLAEIVVLEVTCFVLSIFPPLQIHYLSIHFFCVVIVILIVVWKPFAVEGYPTVCVYMSQTCTRRKAIRLDIN